MCLASRLPTVVFCQELAEIVVDDECVVDLADFEP